MNGHRSFKDRMFNEFARVGQAVASPKRLEVLDLLAQGPRHVEALAQEMQLPVANVSQHVQVLRQAQLVHSSRKGTKTVYRLADKGVLRLLLSLRSVAETQLAEVERINREARGPEAGTGLLPRAELERLIAEDRVLVLDVRPAVEYQQGHLPGALSLPVDDLPARLQQLPRARDLVVYCRGSYCLWADEALQLLRASGFKVLRLEGGWEEWWDEERPMAVESEEGPQ